MCNYVCVYIYIHMYNGSLVMIVVHDAQFHHCATRDHPFHLETLCCCARAPLRD